MMKKEPLAFSFPGPQRADPALIAAPSHREGHRRNLDLKENL